MHSFFHLLSSLLKIIIVPPADPYESPPYIGPTDTP